MKKRLSAILMAGFLCAAMSTQTHAAQGLTISQTIVEDSIRQLDIMTGNKNGDLLLQNNVSRAEFATMLVSASTYKNVSTQFGYTLFPDVPSTYWAAGYIKVVLEHGYMMGYLDGTFRPNQPVLLEEAVTAVLSLLGYDGNTLSGTYPQAQLAKFFELHLDEYMSVNQGQAITREQCMYLFYNLMNTDTVQGTPYASTMGQTVTASGDLDTVALTNKNTLGPFLVGSTVFPAEIDHVSRIYRNDKEALAKDLTQHDVCYYNSKLNALWIYSEKVTGRLTNIANPHFPTGVTVAGQTYTLETSELVHKLSTGTSFREGDLVTLLLGQYGEVADIISAYETDATLVGVVLGRGINQYESDSGNLYTSNYVQMITTKGEIFEFDSQGKYYDAGRVIEVTYNGGEQTTTGLGNKTLSGKVNSDVTAIGTYKLAEDVQLFEMSEGTSTYQTVYKNRIADYFITEDDVRYYTTNSRGEVDSIIFKDITGDLSTFGLITNVVEVDAGMTLMGQYTYLNHGTPSLESTTTRIFNLRKGGAVFLYDEGSLDEIINLESEEVTKLNALEVNFGGKTCTLADDVQVYLIYNNIYQTVSLSDVSDLKQYKLTAYYDEGIFSAGQLVRIILAEELK